jgi:hypothetical protein
MQFHERLSQMEREGHCGHDVGNLQGTLHRSSPPAQADAGVSAANSGYHVENAAVGQTEDQKAEATIGTLANLATATTTDRGVVATLTNSRLAKQLEDRSNELKDIKALLKKKRADKKGQRTFNPSP